MTIIDRLQRLERAPRPCTTPMDLAAAAALGASIRELLVLSGGPNGLAELLLRAEHREVPGVDLHTLRLAARVEASC